MPHVAMLHEVEPREAILNLLGDLSDLKIFNNQVLVAIYMRPELTRGGIALPRGHLDEDKHQSKVGLVVKLGPDAFQPDPEGKWSFNGVDIKIHDWIVFRPSDGWQITVNKILCRILDDTNIRGSVQHPDTVW